MQVLYHVFLRVLYNVKYKVMSKTRENPYHYISGSRRVLITLSILRQQCQCHLFIKALFKTTAVDQCAVQLRNTIRQVNYFK